MDFLEVRLQAHPATLPALAGFYGTRLGFERLEETESGSAVTIGTTRLEFAPGPKEPFYHFALLVPGNRFREALDWARARTDLLPDPDTGEVVFQFADWGAGACYFHDPAGNIVELIAHAGLGETTVEGAFEADELLGFSELGLVGDTALLATLLGQRLGLDLWDGTADVAGRLAFVGEAGRTLILCPPDRPWLPTGRPAETHPLDVVLSGVEEAEALAGEGRLRIRRRNVATRRGALEAASRARGRTRPKDE